jgi:hypothetical protein
LIFFFRFSMHLGGAIRRRDQLKMEKRECPKFSCTITLITFMSVANHLLTDPLELFW